MPGRGQRRNSADVTPLGGTGSNENQAARSIIDLRHEDNTKRGYQGKIRRMSAYLLTKEEFHGALDDSNILDPAKISYPILTAIFGELGTNPDYASEQSKRRAAELHRDGSAAGEVMSPEGANATQDDNIFDGRNHVTMAVSTMQGYKSALVNYFDQCKVVWTREMDNWVEQFIDGYGKLIAEKKEKGVMAMQEGKNHLQFSAYQEITKYMMSVGPPSNENERMRLTQIDGRARAPAQQVMFFFSLQQLPVFVF